MADVRGRSHGQPAQFDRGGDVGQGGAVSLLNRPVNIVVRGDDGWLATV